MFMFSRVTKPWVVPAPVPVGSADWNGASVPLELLPTLVGKSGDVV
jgi:hypothetical protein